MSNRNLQLITSKIGQYFPPRPPSVLCFSDSVNYIPFFQLLRPKASSSPELFFSGSLIFYQLLREHGISLQIPVHLRKTLWHSDSCPSVPGALGEPGPHLNKHLVPLWRNLETPGSPYAPSPSPPHAHTPMFFCIFVPDGCRVRDEEHVFPTAQILT